MFWKRTSEDSWYGYLRACCHTCHPVTDGSSKQWLQPVNIAHWLHPAHTTVMYWRYIVTACSEWASSTWMLSRCSWSSKADRLISSTMSSTVRQYETVRPRRRRPAPCSRVRTPGPAKRSPAKSGASVSRGTADRRAKSVSVFTRLRNNSSVRFSYAFYWRSCCPAADNIEAIMIV